MDKVLSREDFVLELFVVSRRISIIAQKVEAIDKLKASHEALRLRAEQAEAWVKTMVKQLDEADQEVLRLKSEVERVEKLEKALSQIERGCSFPEDDVQKTIVQVARAALEDKPCV